jgi:hypothetical protein
MFNVPRKLNQIGTERSFRILRRPVNLRRIRRLAFAWSLQ